MISQTINLPVQVHVRYNLEDGDLYEVSDNKTGCVGKAYDLEQAFLLYASQLVEQEEI